MIQCLRRSSIVALNSPRHVSIECVDAAGTDGIYRVPMITRTFDILCEYAILSDLLTLNAMIIIRKKSSVDFFRIIAIAQRRRREDTIPGIYTTIYIVPYFKTKFLSQHSPLRLPDMQVGTDMRRRMTSTDILSQVRRQDQAITHQEELHGTSK